MHAREDLCEYAKEKCGRAMEGEKKTLCVT